ncbi:hypothetical protein G6F59_017700 [Rhizopus arrhizus]|nr:hypothetical protein G6F59_017700 [Rhizopus arrhizus]
MAGHGAELGRGVRRRHGAAGALARRPSDGTRPGPHPGQQPVRSVRAVLADHGAVLPVLRTQIRHASTRRLRAAGGDVRRGLPAVVFVYARRGADPAAGAGLEELVDEAARAG